MRQAPFFEALAAAPDVGAVVGVLDAAARDRGAHSAAYFHEVDGRFVTWSTNDPEWRARYAAEGLGAQDPERRRETRPARAQWFRFARMEREGPHAPFYARIAAAGFAAGLYVPDPSPLGTRDMATVNLTLRRAPGDLEAWIAGPGYELQMMSVAALARIGDLRGLEGDASPLTAREAEVLELIAQGLRPAAIAGRMDISERTVEFHLRGVRARLGVPTRDAAVARAAAEGWIRVR